MVVKQLLQYILLAVLLHSLPPPISSKEGGCTAPLLLPDLPFFVVWNHPTDGCERHGLDLGFAKWGIVDNEKDRFIGEQISLFYSLGQWPYISGSTKVNGGIPQLGNLTAHLQKARQEVIDIMQQNFTGLSVIDFESWRPLFRLNFDSLKKYQDLSIALAKQKYPSMNSTQLIAEATKEFEGAARSFVGETLMELSSLRPKGKWGYYGYPRCWGSCGGEYTVAENDKMSWIFKRSTGLYPSIYFTPNPKSSPADHIKGILGETLRVKAKFSRQDAVVFPYSLSQSSPYNMFTVADLSYAIGVPADMGASGVVLWGSSKDLVKNECLLLQQYINSTLGPYVKNITDFFSACSQQNCGDHGRCVRKDYEIVYQQHLMKRGETRCRIPAEALKRKQKLDKFSNFLSLSAKVGAEFVKIRFNSTALKFKRREFITTGESAEDIYSLTYDFDDYVCKCYAGWTGSHCKQTISSDTA